MCTDLDHKALEVVTSGRKCTVLRILDEVELQVSCDLQLLQLECRNYSVSWLMERTIKTRGVIAVRVATRRTIIMRGFSM